MKPRNKLNQWWSPSKRKTTFDRSNLRAFEGRVGRMCRKMIWKFSRGISIVLIVMMNNWTSWQNSVLKRWWKSSFGRDQFDIIRSFELGRISFRQKPQVILLQQVGTFALTLIITSLSPFYDDESVQIGTGKGFCWSTIDRSRHA